MARRRRIEGILRFPEGLLVEPDVLGASLEVSIGESAARLTFPVTDGSPTWPRLGAPPCRSQPVLDQLATEGWGTATNDSWRVTAAVISILANPVADPRTSAEVLAFESAFDKWFEAVHEWICVAHRIPRTSLTTSRPTTIQGYDSTIGPWGVGAQISMKALGGLRGGSLEEVRAASAAASRGLEPPLHHRVWIDALTEFHQSDHRRSVIDAATAAEVGLALAITRQLATAGVAESAVEAVLSLANGLMDLLALARSVVGDRGPSSRRVANELAGVRNRAAHSGMIPTDAESQRALRCAREILDELCPAVALVDG